MKFNKKYASEYIIGGILIFALVYGLNKWLKGLPAPAPEYDTSSSIDYSLVLSNGSQGAEVSELQKILKTKYKADLGTFGDNKDGIDGIFGDVTEKALVKAKGVNKIALKDL